MAKKDKLVPYVNLPQKQKGKSQKRDYPTICPSNPASINLTDFVERLYSDNIALAAENARLTERLAAITFIEGSAVEVHGTEDDCNE